jgi:hypothetical protein
MRELLTREILDHMAAIACGPHVCFIEPKYSGTGPDEQEEVARYLRDHHGLSVVHADPSELELHQGRVWYHGRGVDLVYRDYGVTDLLELQAEGVDVEPMRQLLRENRVISSIAADLDQKSCWEVLTDPDLCRRYFNPDERLLFQRHILWTRVLSDRRTVLPDGRTGDLLEYVRRGRESLVIKPNRGYGGEGVVLGHLVSQAEWESAVERALGGGERWVAQERAPIPEREFPVVGADGAVRFEPFFIVMGFVSSPYGVGALIRVSPKAVVNVAQQGGLCAMMVGHAACGVVGAEAP